MKSYIKNKQLQDMTTHNMIFEKDGQRIVFDEWIDDENGYYAEICASCAEKYGFSDTEPVDEHEGMPPCMTEDCWNIARCKVTFSGTEVAFEEKGNS